MNDFSPLFSPLDLELTAEILNARKTIENILAGKDKRLLLIVGPCSIHSIDEALEYARLLKNLSLEISDTFFVVMRAYMEKSRTSLGWRGFLRDPDGDNSCDLQKGILSTRLFLTELARLKLPCAAEFLDPMLTPFYSDLISWGSIGARTVQSPVHRQLASTLCMPIGFKNRTDGNIDVAIEAIDVAASPHTYLEATSRGTIELKKSEGNACCHLVLRGSDLKGNADPESIRAAQKKLTEKELIDAIVVDCSHGNAEKNYKNQIAVFERCMTAIQDGVSAIKGLMLESYLCEGRTDHPAHSSGTSITDPCLNFQETAALLRAYATQEAFV